MSTTAKRLDHFVRLGKEARSDIKWWWRFCEGWNGVAVLPGPPEARAHKNLRLRRIRLMGLRCVLGRTVVPATVARWHAGCSHHLQRANSHCSGDSNMGQALAEQYSASAM